MKAFKAIAAMAENRVIGVDNRIPWHLPSEFRWFKQMTVGQIIVMGRKTFESIGRPLPDRETVVLSRSQRHIPGIRVVSDFAEIDPAKETREVFICGGAQVYALALPLCSDLYLSLIKGKPDGNVFFPPFEAQFLPLETIADEPEFRIVHYRNKELT